MMQSQEETENISEESEITGGNELSEEQNNAEGESDEESLESEESGELSYEAEGEYKAEIPQQKTQKQINEENNEKNIRAASNALKDKGIPYASAVAKGVDAADKISGGKSTQMLAKGLNRANKITPGGRKFQRNLNRMGQSGATDALGGASKGTVDIDHSSGKGTFELKIPLKVKIIFWIAIIGAALLFLLFFVVLFGSEVASSSTATGASTYGQACPVITMTDSDCDENNENCTNQYNGEIDYETYIAGVVAATIGNVNNEEIYKLAAVDARTNTQANIGGSCTVSANSSFQDYMPIEESPYASQILAAVEDTKGEVIVIDGAPVEVYNTDACVVGMDAQNYYIRYGAKTLNSAKIQTISKSWDANHGNRLKSLYDLSNNESDTNYLTNPCPGNNNDDGLSIIGAENLITEHGYDYEDVINHYYGKKSSVSENSIMLSGVNGYVNPIRTIYCSSPFGKRDDPTAEEAREEIHTGLDMSLEEGEPIFAAKAGTIVAVVKNVKAINNRRYGYGNYVKIKHDDGTETLYAHMKYRSIKSKIVVGYNVAQGEQIGQVGSTGNSTGPHLHYEVIKNGDYVDPTDYMDLTDAQGTCH